MTLVHEQPSAPQTRMTARLFEELAALAERDDVRLEFLGGKIVEKPVPDGVHSEIIMWLQRICVQSFPSHGLYAERGLRVEEYRKGRARPDAVLAPLGSFLQDGEWSVPDDSLMVVEVTSYDRDTEQRDRIDKPRAYAEAGIPVYLLIDRDARVVVVYSEPDGQRYETVHRRPFGRPVHVPEPVGLDLDTEPLTRWVR